MTSNLSVSNVLNFLLKKTGISESDLARKTELPRNTINRLTTGKTPDPRISTLQAIAGYFHISLDQLLGKSPIAENFSNSIDGIRHLPIIDIEKTFQWKKTLSNITPSNYHEWIITEPSDFQTEFCITIKGDAMWPQFHEGNIAVIDPHKSPENRDFILANIFKTGEIILRQFFTDNNIKVLKAINPLFPPTTLTGKDKIIGIVVETRMRY